MDTEEDAGDRSSSSDSPRAPPSSCFAFSSSSSLTARPLLRRGLRDSGSAGAVPGAHAASVGSTAAVGDRAAGENGREATAAAEQKLRSYRGQRSPLVQSHFSMFSSSSSERLAAAAAAAPAQVAAGSNSSGSRRLRENMLRSSVRRNTGASDAEDAPDYSLLSSAAFSHYPSTGTSSQKTAASSSDYKITVARPTAPPAGPADGRRTSSFSGKSDRLHRLEQRLAGLHAGLEKQRRQRVQHLAQKLQQVEEEVRQVSSSSAGTQQALREQLRKVESELKESQTLVHADAAKREQQALDLEKKLSQLLDAEQQALRDLEGSLLKTFSEKTKKLQATILENGHLHQEEIAALREYCDEEIPKLREGLQREGREREEMERRILKQAAEEIDRLNGQLAAERDARERHLQSLLSLFEEVVREVQRDLSKEKADREKMQEDLVSLMEQTIERITHSCAS